MPSIISPTGRALQAEIAKLSPDQAMAKINQGVGLVPFPELLAMKMQMDRIKKAAPPQQAPARTTVADDMKQQMAGVAALPTRPNMFQQPQGMAGGGIVAFAGGGLTPRQIEQMNAGDYSDPDVQAYIAAQRGQQPSYGYSVTMPKGAMPGAPFAEGGLTPPKTDYGPNTYWQAVKDRVKELMGPNKVGKGLADKAAQDIAGRQKAIDKAVEDASMAAGGIVAFAEGGKTRKSGSLGEAYKNYVTDYFGLQPAFDAYDTTAGALGTVGRTLGDVFGSEDSAPSAPSAPSPAASPSGGTLGQYDLWTRNHGGAPEVPTAYQMPTATPPPLPPGEDPYSLAIGTGGRNPASLDLSRVEQDRRGIVGEINGLKQGMTDPQLAQVEAENAARRQAAGLGAAEVERAAVLKGRAADTAKDYKQDKWMAAANGFFRMAQAASQPGASFLGAASEGAVTGGREAQAALGAYRKAKDANEDAQYQLAAAQEAVKRGDMSEDSKDYHQKVGEAMVRQQRLDQLHSVLMQSDAGIAEAQARSGYQNAMLRASTSRDAIYNQILGEANRYRQAADKARASGDLHLAGQYEAKEAELIQKSRGYNPSIIRSEIGADSATARAQLPKLLDQRNQLQMMVAGISDPQRKAEYQQQLAQVEAEIARASGGGGGGSPDFMYDPSSGQLVPGN